MSSFTSMSMDRVSEIIELERRADSLESDASLLRWQAAERIAAELESGKSQRQLAKEIKAAGGKLSQSSISRYWSLWDRFGTESDRPVFWEAFKQLPGQLKPPIDPPPPDPRPAIEPAEDEDSGIVDAEIVPQDDTERPGLPEWDSEAFRNALQDNEDSTPDAKKLWDEMRKANAHLLAVNEYLERGVIVGGMAERTVTSFATLLIRSQDNIKEAYGVQG